LIDKLLNVAIPPTALTVVVPLKVPAGVPALVPIASETARVLLATRLLDASSIRTVTAGEIVASLLVFDGWIPKLSFVAGAWTVIPFIKVKVPNC
jgi:hypothetical protein